MSEVVRIATRGSQLALSQTGLVRDLLKAAHPGYDFQILTFKTTGDTVTDRPLASFRGQGVFVKELRSALLRGEADLAVHSLKDVPVEIFEGLTFAGYPARESPLDVLLTNRGSGLHGLSPNAVIGTGSPRRQVQLRSAAPFLRFENIRGNLDTRIKKLRDGLFDGIVVARAGMTRLGKAVDPCAILSTDLCLPAAGQGALVLECRGDDPRTIRIAASLDDAHTRIAVECERAFLREIGGGCALPVAALARIREDSILLECMIGDPESGRIVRDQDRETLGQADRLAGVLAVRIRLLCEENGIAVP